MTGVIIDSHTHIINHREPVWGWGPHFKVEQLLATMDREYDVMGEWKRVDKAIVMGSLGVTAIRGMTLRAAHEYAIESVQKHTDRLYLNPVINPRLWGPDELEHLVEWKEKFNVCMLKLQPTMHNYHLPLYNPYPTEHSKELVYPVMEMARRLDVPVMIHMGEPPHSIPASIAPLAEAYPDVPIVMAHSGANNEISYAADAILVARTHDNVYLEISWIQPFDLTQAAYALGAGKIIFGSDCAPQSMGQQMRLVINLHLPPPLGAGMTEAEVYKMLGGNIAQLCKIPV